MIFRTLNLYSFLLVFTFSIFSSTNHPWIGPGLLGECSLDGTSNNFHHFGISSVFREQTELDLDKRLMKRARVEFDLLLVFTSSYLFWSDCLWWITVEPFPGWTN